LTMVIFFDPCSDLFVDDNKDIRCSFWLIFLKEYHF
jgi:hypothetical protein